MTREELEKLAEEVNALSPPDRLRLAADLLEGERFELAHQVVERVSIELGALLALGRRRK